jgi:hypothetical protein
MDFMELREIYRTKAREHVQSWNVPPEEFDHITTIITSVMMTRDGYDKGGHFVQHVIDNNLLGAISHADTTCARFLKPIVTARDYCFI